MKLRFPLPEMETWDEADRIFDWCDMRKFDVHFRSTHHQAAVPKSVFAMRKAAQLMRDGTATLIGSSVEVMRNYEIIFDSDDCAIEYRLRFL